MYSLVMLLWFRWGLLNNHSGKSGTFDLTILNMLDSLISGALSLMMQEPSFSIWRKFRWVARRHTSLKEVTRPRFLLTLRASRIVSLVRREIELYTSSNLEFFSTSRSLLALNARKYPSGVCRQMELLKVTKSRDSLSSNLSSVNSSYMFTSRSFTYRIGWCPVARTLPSC